MKISRVTILWLIIVLVLVTTLIGELLGVFSIESALTNFYIFMIALLTITVLAIIGAVFLGIFISHRIFSVRDFTPFEKEMLSMKEDVEEIREQVRELKEGKK